MDPVPALPERFGPFLLVRTIGSGGMGNVYLVRTPWDDRPVAALKRMHNEDPLLEERFRHEAALTVRLDHPNLIATYDVGAVGEELYVCSELILGKDLGAITQSLSRNSRGCTVAMAAGVMCDVLSALSYIHAARDIDGTPLNLVHRDIKPANVIVGYDGVARVADFGAAKSLLTQGMQLTAPGTLVATPTSIAPELLRGEQATPASDIYSLGSSIYRLLTGVPPHPGKSVKQVLMSVLLETPKPLSAFRPDLPSWFSELVHQTLIKDRDARPQDASKLLAYIGERSKQTGVTISHQSTGRWLASAFGSEYSSEIAERDRIASLGREAIEELEQETRVFASSPNLFDKKSTRSDMFELHTDVGMPRLDAPAGLREEVGEFEVETKVDKIPQQQQRASKVSAVRARLEVGPSIEEDAHAFSDRTVREPISAPITAPVAPIPVAAPPAPSSSMHAIAELVRRTADPASPQSGLFSAPQESGYERPPPTMPVELPMAAMRRAAPPTQDLLPETEPVRVAPSSRDPLVDDLIAPPLVFARPADSSGELLAPDADRSMPVDALAHLVPPPQPDLASLIPPVPVPIRELVQPTIRPESKVETETLGQRLRNSIRTIGLVAFAIAIGFAIGSVIEHQRSPSIERAGELAALSVELKHVREVLRADAQRGEIVSQESWMLLDSTWAALQEGNVDEASRLLEKLRGALPAEEPSANQ